MPATITKPDTEPTRSDSQKGRCTHLRANGRRCADAVYPGHASLCHFHLGQQMRGITDGNLIAADILASIGNFQSASAINLALGKVLTHQLTGRISRQDALALAYTCQLLLQTLPHVKAELKDCDYYHWWRKETSRILSAPSDLDEITNPALLPDSTTPLHPTTDDTPDPAAASPAPDPSPGPASATRPAAPTPAPALAAASPANSVAALAPTVPPVPSSVSSCTAARPPSVHSGTSGAPGSSSDTSPSPLTQSLASPQTPPRPNSAAACGIRHPDRDRLERAGL